MIRIKTIDPSDIDTPARSMSDSLRSQLGANKTVLWLVSGGSAIRVAVRARELLGGLDDTINLHIALVDERFGAVGHADSNAEQLLQAGFDTSGLTFHYVLTGENIEATSSSYAAKLDDLSSDVDHVYGLFGMGADGHTAGLLPGNPLMDSSSVVGHFDGPDYQRVTVTPSFIECIDEAILYAVGRDKWPTIEELATTDLPAACLRDIPKLAIYSDYTGEKS